MGSRLTEKAGIPELTPWITLPDAAEILGISRQHAYNRAVQGVFSTLHRIGKSTFVVSSEEVQDLLDKSLE